MRHTLHFLPGSLEAIPGVSAGVDDVQGGVCWLDDAGHVRVTVACPGAAVIRAIIDHQGAGGAGDLEKVYFERGIVFTFSNLFTENDSMLSLMPYPSSTLSSHLHPPVIDSPVDSISPPSPKQPRISRNSWDPEKYPYPVCGPRKCRGWCRHSSRDTPSWRCPGRRGRSYRWRLRWCPQGSSPTGRSR